MRDLRQRGTGHGPRRVATAVGVALLAAALWGGGPARAGDGAAVGGAGRPGLPPLPPAAAAAPRPTGGGFFHGHLLPRLEKQFEALRPYQVLSAEHGHLVFEQASRAARHRARRGTQRALEEYLLAATPVRRFVEALEVGARRGGGGRSPRIGVGVRSGVPDLEYRLPLGRGLVRTALSVEGRIRLEYRGGRAADVGLRADFDPRSGELDLAYRIGF